MASDTLIERNRFTNENFHCLLCRSLIQFNLPVDWFTHCPVVQYSVHKLKTTKSKEWCCFREKKKCWFSHENVKIILLYYIQYIGQLIVIFLFHWETNNANSTSLLTHRKWNMKIRCTRMDLWSSFADEQQEKIEEKHSWEKWWPQTNPMYEVGGKSASK